MKHYLIPQRLTGESSEDYKLRRAIGNIYSKQSVKGRSDMRERAETEAWKAKSNVNAR